MIVLDVKIDNFYAFNNFEMNMTYPKKIVGSYIEDEHLEGCPNFRYRKVNIIMGANASGKTTFGKMLMDIFNFIDKKNYDKLVMAIRDKSRNASFTIDFVSKSRNMYRLTCVIKADKEARYSSEYIDVSVKKIGINQKDSYESCVKRLEETSFEKSASYVEELEKIEEIFWMFVYPSDSFEEGRLNLMDLGEDFEKILESTLKALDPAVLSAKKSSEIDDAFVVQLGDKNVVLQNGEVMKTDLLSSGTKAGVAVASIIASIKSGKCSFYYCDEKFSYIHSDIEKAILAVMIGLLRPNDQLFFTTHNTDILDLDLPKHTFTFMRKSVGDETQIECITASDLLKRNTDCLRKAVENDLFSSAPATDKIYELADMKAV